MAGNAGLKAGLIGAAILFVLTLLALIPVAFLDCVCCGVELLAYAGIGVLAGSFLTAPRDAGTGAGAGAIAGVISGLVAGIISMIVAAIQGATGAASAGLLDPQMLEQLTELGVELDPEMLEIFTGAGAGAGMGILGGSLCCVGSLAIGAALGAIGGAIFGASKSD